MRKANCVARRSSSDALEGASVIIYKQIGREIPPKWRGPAVASDLADSRVAAKFQGRAPFTSLSVQLPAPAPSFDRIGSGINGPKCTPKDYDALTYYELHQSRWLPDYEKRDSKSVPKTRRALGRERAPETEEEISRVAGKRKRVEERHLASVMDKKAVCKHPQWRVSSTKDTWRAPPRPPHGWTGCGCLCLDG